MSMELPAIEIGVISGKDFALGLMTGIALRRGRIRQILNQTLPGSQGEDTNGEDQ